MPDAPDLHSFKRGGQLAKTWVYSANRFAPFVIPYRWETGPPNPDPYCFRLVVKESTVDWHAFTAEQKAAYAAVARRLKLTPYTAFIKARLIAHKKSILHIIHAC